MGGGAGIRVAEAGDVARIVELNRAHFREDFAQRDPFINQGWPEKEGEHHFGSLLVGERSVCLLDEFDGEVVGYLAGYAGAGAYIRPVAVAELESMYVMEGYRDRDWERVWPRDSWIGLKLEVRSGYR
jgi:hypothetical protein